MDIIVNRMVRQAIPLFNVFASLAIVLLLTTLLKLGSEIFIPVALAVLLSFALAPVAGWLQRSGLGRGPSVVLAVLLALGIVLVLGYVIITQVSDLAAQLPSYKAVIREKLRAMIAGMSEGGPFSRAGQVIGELFEDVKKMSDAKPDAAVVVRAEPASGWKLASDWLGGLLHPLATFAIVFLILAFILGQREDLRNRLIRLVGTEDLQKTTAALDDAGLRLGKLLLAQLTVNACFGAAVGTGLWAIGLPSPFLWGVLAGVLRFVPYIGAFIGMVPPLFIAFALDPTWSSVLWTAALFIVIDPIVGHVIEPLVYGKSTGLSPLAVVVSATVWAFLWGPVGLVLSTPLTICLVVLGRHVKRLHFLDVVLGDRPVLEPHEIFYQRMLAGDPREASEQARAFLGERALATYIDEVALNAIRRAHQDVVRGSVSGERLGRMVASSRALVESLKDMPEGRRVPLRPAGLEAQAAFERIGSDRAVARERIDRMNLDAAWHASHPVAILYGAHPMDEVPARMLAQVIERYGLPVRVAPLAEADKASEADVAGVRLVFLSFIEPLSTLHLRAASIQVHRRAKNARVAMAIWQEADAAFIDTLRRQLRVDALVTKTSEALEATSLLVRAPAARKPAA